MQAPATPWARFSAWLECVCVVTFDLELGQALEVSEEWGRGGVVARGALCAWGAVGWPVRPPKLCAGHLLSGALASKGTKGRLPPGTEEIGALHFGSPKRYP